MVKFITRRDWFGIGKETTSGTPVVVTDWISRDGWYLQENITTAEDNWSYWRIETTTDVETVKIMSEITVPWTLKDDDGWHLFNAALGTHIAVTAFAGWTPTWTTPARGDIIYQGATFWTATWTWVLRKIVLVNSWATTLYRVSTTSGSFADATDVKEQTDSRTIGTVDSATYAGAYGHLFQVQNDNNHPSYTLYSSNPNGDYQCGYGMITNLNLTAEIGNYVKFEAGFMAKQKTSTTSQTPVYVENNYFLAKDTKIYFADTEAQLNWSSSVCMQSATINIEKNLKDTQCLWSVDIDSINNQNFDISWSFNAFYTDNTLLDYILNSDKKAVRFEMINSGATALATNVFPSIYVDAMRIWFTWNSFTDDLDTLVSQTLDYKGTYSTSDASMVEILLVNWVSADY